MNTQELLQQAEALRNRIQSYARDDDTGSPGAAAKAQVCEFLCQYAGTRSAFTKQAEAVKGFASDMVSTLMAILDSFIEYLKCGLASALSPERKAQLDVVSDILEQAHYILEDNRYHPASA